MSQPRSAKLTAVQHFSRSSLLTFRPPVDTPLVFRGGQYVIVDTGLELADGRRRKRAFSIISSDADSRSFTLAVYAVEGGLGADAMRRLRPGDTLTFSGPWGKLSAPEAPSEAPLWIIATDTGLSAAVGLLRSTAFDGLRGRIRFAHLNHALTPFLERDAWCDALTDVGHVYEGAIPPIGSPERPGALGGLVRAWLEHGAPQVVYLCGDGALPERVRVELADHGAVSVTVQAENFFNHPARKSDTTG
jgi:ferredoxin-NADP reductase